MLCASACCALWRLCTPASAPGPSWLLGCRQALGNSADVSKGLRQLYSKGRILRTGKGGRQGPFKYAAK